MGRYATIGYILNLGYHKYRKDYVNAPRILEMALIHHPKEARPYYREAQALRDEGEIKKRLRQSNRL